MRVISDWLLKHRITLLEYLDKKAPTQAPPAWWWVIIAAIGVITAHVNIVFKKLQSKGLLITQQTTELQQLAVVISAHLGIEEPNDSDSIVVADDNTVVHERWSVSHSSVIGFLQDQGSFVSKIFNEELSSDLLLQRRIIHMIGRFGLIIVEGILDIQAERDNSNRAAMENIPGMLPHELVKIKGRDFGKIVEKHTNQLKHIWTTQSIAEIEIEHQQLLLAYIHEPLLKNALDQCTHDTSFKAAWEIVGDRFKKLRDFCGEIASVFPNTATVESDFSVLNWEKDEYRLSLTDLSLESIIQCRQFKVLSELVDEYEKSGFI